MTDKPFQRIGTAALPAVFLALGLSSCTVYHSKQADFATVAGELEPSSTFVTEEDSGLLLLGIFSISEPDHFAVLLDRAQRRHNCDQLRFAQLDFYTDYWLLVGFPISRVTLICECSAQPISGEGAIAP